jgi:hypothetical protein
VENGPSRGGGADKRSNLAYRGAGGVVGKTVWRPGARGALPLPLGGANGRGNAAER